MMLGLLIFRHSDRFNMAAAISHDNSQSVSLTSVLILYCCALDLCPVQMSQFPVMYCNAIQCNALYMLLTTTELSCLIVVKLLVCRKFERGDEIANVTVAEHT